MTEKKPLESRAFEGRRALVTGAGRGIGRALALGLAAAGAQVAILARTQTELDRVAAAIGELGGNAHVIRADVGDRDQVARAANVALAEFGVVDLLINNAGVVWPLGPTSSVDPAEWAAAIGINLLGPVALTRALLPVMLANGFGRIVNVSSGIAARPGAMIGGNAYAASKAALEAHTLNLAAELLGSGVTVNVYRPGGVDTAMQAWIRDQPPEQVGSELHERFVNSFAQGTLISPERSARVLLEHLGGGDTGQVWTFSDT